MPCSFTIVTFNSFPGSPFFISGIGVVGNEGSRLYRQMDALGEIPAYDIGCFQEVFSRRAVSAYIRFHRSRGMVPLHNGQSSIPRTSFCWTCACFLVALHFSSEVLPLILRGLLASLVAALGWSLLKCFEESSIFAFTCLSHNHSGLMTFYNARRFQWLDTRVVSLGGWTSDPMNLFQPRQGHIHLFCERETGVRFYIINTHLNALGKDTARSEQLHKLYSSLSHIAHPFPTILCGDLNMEQGVDEEEDGMRKNVLITWDPFKNPMCRGWLRSTPPCQIDHIKLLSFRSRPSRPISVTTTQTFHMDFTSDHYLLLGCVTIE